MTDPTQKPCPRCRGSKGVWNERGTWSDCDCLPTGTVPLTTGELLEALGSTHDFELACRLGEFAVLCEDFDPPEVFYDTPYDALRAALRAVTE